MIIFRYLVKEILVTIAALTSILLLIFLSNQFVHYLSRAAAGSFPGSVVVKLMMLEIPNLLGLLLPLGFYIAILLTLGRLYAESEMTVLNSCGYSENKLLGHTLIIAVFISIIVGGLVFFVTPDIAKNRRQLIRGGGISDLIKTIIPQRFREVGGGKVIYVQNMSRDHSTARGVFLAEPTKDNQGNAGSWNIVWADEGFFYENDKTGENFIVLKNGDEYEGTPGKGNLRVVSFEKYEARLPQNNVVVDNSASTLPTKDLFPLNNHNRLKAAELQWRISIPLMTLVLAFLAVPLSKVNPRDGKYAKILPAIIIYIVYANMMFVVRDWLSRGKIPLWAGMWWLHGLMLLLALFFIWFSRLRKA